jgi:hypothetical protein
MPEGAAPNLIPLRPSAIHRILEQIEPFQFEHIYRTWWGADILCESRRRRWQWVGPLVAPIEGVQLRIGILKLKR